MRRGELERAEEIFGELEGSIAGRTCRDGGIAPKSRLLAAICISRKRSSKPLLETSDDPEYRAIHAEILAARGDDAGAASEAQRAAAGYASLLARRPEAYADHAAAFFMGIGNRPLLAVGLAAMNPGAPRHASLTLSSRPSAAVRRGSSRPSCSRIARVCAADRMTLAFARARRRVHSRTSRGPITSPRSHLTPWTAGAAPGRPESDGDSGTLPACSASGY